MKKKVVKYLFLILSVALFSCSVNNKQNKITAVITSQLDFNMGANWSVLNNTETFHNWIYYRNNQRLLKITYFNVGLDSPYTFTPKQYFFIHKTNQKYGYKYDTCENIIGQKLLVDSALKNLFTIDEDYLKNLNLNTPYIYEISSKYSKDLSYIIKEINYFHGGKAIGDDTVSTGKLFLTYNKELLNFKYSLSKTFDTIPKMKLFKIYFQNDPIYYKEQNKTFVPPNFIFQINEMKNINEKEVMPLFLKHEND
jgi:hypothetical protein